MPQSISLFNDTIIRNIAFGVPDVEINIDAVEKVARIANIHDFIVGELASGYNTMVGDRGIKLSGGQRQRIGIARALYHNPDVLVFDEATSALDNATEKSVLNAINKLSNKKTIIIITHRLSTLKQCDVISMIENGRIIAQGSYDDLMKTCKQFRSLSTVD